MAPRLPLLAIVALMLLFLAVSVRCTSRNRGVEGGAEGLPKLAVEYRASSARKWLTAQDVDLPRAILEPDRHP